MTNETFPAMSSTDLQSDVRNTGGPSRAPTYDIAPEHQHHAKAILAMDPIHDVPSPVKFPEGWQAPKLRATALPKEQRGRVEHQLASVAPQHREAKEAELVAAEIRAMRPAIRVATGVGPDATPYHREMVAIAREYADYSKEFDRYADDLKEVERYDSTTNEKGEPVAVPVYRIRGQKAVAWVNHQEDLARRMRLLTQEDGTPGIEGAKRLKQALHESVEARSQLAEQVAENAEVTRRAAEAVREERIAKRVASKVRMSRNDF